MDALDEMTMLCDVRALYMSLVLVLVLVLLSKVVIQPGLMDL